MHRRPSHHRIALSAAVLGTLALNAPAPARASLTDLSTWTLVQDLPNPNFTATATADAIILRAGDGAIPSGTDIGFQSVDGDTPAASSRGSAFSPRSSFSLAIDFSVSFQNHPQGTLGIGFGIGEDADGTDSAGVALLFKDGVVAPGLFPYYAAAARVGDATQMPMPIFVVGSSSGAMFVDYDAFTGNVTLGASQSPGATVATATATFDGLQNHWSGTDLLVSLFLRSDGILGNAWQGGEAQVVFSDLRLITGTPFGVPAPASALLLALGLILARARHRAARSQGRSPFPSPSLPQNGGGKQGRAPGATFAVRNGLLTR